MLHKLELGLFIYTDTSTWWFHMLACKQTGSSWSSDMNCVGHPYGLDRELAPNM